MMVNDKFEFHERILLVEEKYTWITKGLKNDQLFSHLFGQLEKFFCFTNEATNCNCTVK